MNIKFFITVLLSVFISFSTAAEEFAFGVSIGTPTGLSARYKLNGYSQIQADLSGSYTSADYVLIDERNFGVDELSWFYGAGVVSRKSIGVRVLSGAEYDFDKVPFHAFGNISFTAADKTGLGIAVGARYDF